MKTLLLILLAAGCTTPAILLDPHQGPCGEYPVDCGTANGVSYCCPENNLCRMRPDGSRYCEFSPEMQRHIFKDGGTE